MYLVINLKRVDICVKEQPRERVPLSFEYNDRTYDVEIAYFCQLQESLTGVLAFKCLCKVAGKWHTLWMDGSNWFVEIE